MKVMNWNIEWMNNWFVGGDSVAIRDSYLPAGRPNDAIQDVDGLCRRVAHVIQVVDPDVLTVQEGPSDLREMELFVENYLQDGDGNALYRAFGGHVSPLSRGAQKNFVLVKNDGAVSDPRELTDLDLVGLVDEWQADIDGIGHLQPYQFTRRPLVIEFGYEGETIRVINLHLKSKYIHNGEDLWNNPDTQPDFIQEALVQRRRISAEAMRMRTYLDELVNDNLHAPIIMVGDFNDGPGADLFEQYYLTHNLTDILLGSTYEPQLLFNHAFLTSVPAAERFTARFDDFIEEEEDVPLVLDHILVSPSLRTGNGVPSGLLNGRIAHREFEEGIDPTANSEREIYPSDHRPVVAVFGP